MKRSKIVGFSFYLLRYVWSIVESKLIEHTKIEYFSLDFLGCPILVDLKIAAIKNGSITFEI